MVKKIAVTAGLLALMAWLLVYARDVRQAETAAHSHALEEMHGLAHMPAANYAYGRQAWYDNQPAAAERYLRRAVSGNVLHIDAWLMLAQAAAAAGKEEQAAQMVRFTDKLTRHGVKWKWDHILLARGLGIEDIWQRNINFVLPYSELRSDALQLVDRHFNRRPAPVLAVLERDNISYYLRWLMRWRRTDDAWTVWQAMGEAYREKERLYADYVHFLVRAREVEKAAAIWQQYAGVYGMTNPGFENSLSGKGFGWHSWQGSRHCFDIQRVAETARQGRQALNVSFDGTENIRFHHLRQIVPVKPGMRYVLSCAWKSRRLTTDQRPFIEVYGYDGNSQTWRTPMIAADADWHRAELCFSAPENCHAVVVRLRRLPSRRFDSKIAGEMWLDAFSLKAF